MKAKQVLQIYAGKTALALIKREGFNAKMFSAFLGASGGPKWFVLCGLDKVMFEDFFSDTGQRIDIIGTSAGAFRASCFAQKDSKAAIERLAYGYSTTIYSKQPKPQEVSRKGIELLNSVVDSKGRNEILNNEKRALHIISSRCHGLVASESKFKQLAGLGLASLRNFRARSMLSKSFSRSIFYSGIDRLDFTDQDKIQSEYIKLTENNLHEAVMASGSIPLVMEGVSDINHAPRGVYRDGGIIDYHFDIRINTRGLVLYPHFATTPIPGWFDKGIRSRTCKAQSYDNVVMLAPTDEFVASLPYGKIPDRRDFTEMDSEQRIPYWQRVIAESERLAEDFFEQIENDNVANFVQAIRLKR
ncbi:patatin-like phospholipase family protein [Agaribacter flavus]|uniref:Patatin-like phospholipase family protein n=1 Tax=Agaribacter flavus TaxID=1902781 RepID=A0ABV7FQY1_9ALTE